MTIRTLIAATLALGILILANPIQSQESGDDAKKFKEAMEKYGAPGPEHKNLEPMAGKWNVAAKFYMQPGAAPSESKGVSTSRWILGKRYLQQNYKGDAFNMPFSGTGFTGYDRQSKKYVGAWMDSMSTSIMTSEGTYDPKSKTFTFLSEGPDPFTGIKFKTRDTIRIISNDEHVMEMSKTPAAGGDGKYVKVLELRYVRAAKKKKS